MKPTFERVAELLRHEDGILYWRIDRGGVAKSGTRAGGPMDETGRRRVRLLGGRYMEADLVFLLCLGRWPTNRLDHDDGDPGNNKITNLIELSQSENCRNRRRASNNTSGVTGVSWHGPTRKWQAYICEAAGKIKYLGLFDSLEDAETTRREANAYLGYSQRHGSA